MQVKKAIFPVAGLGTRFLPATKAQPKEMLPVVDKPLIQYAVEEAYAAGVRQMIFVTGRHKRPIEDHFDMTFELEVALVLVPAFPAVRRVTARVSATRRDRLTARLPMLWPTDPEGGPGAVRVEVRGRIAGVGATVVLGAMDRPAVAAGAVAAVAVHRVLDGSVARTGAAGLAELLDPRAVLADLAARGVRVAVFEGPGGH